MEGTVRKEAVAGTFYPADSLALQTEVNSLFADVPIPKTTSAPKTTSFPKAIIAPHAGYIYSGPGAAIVYKRLEPAADIIKRVILLGPSHRISFRGLAYCKADYYQTPLGRIAIDHTAIETIRALPQAVALDAPHKDEHCLEVQLPFLQSVLNDFSIVPLVVGDASPTEVAEIIQLLWGDEETLIVISSDLSHFLEYNQANTTDKATCCAIEEFRFNDISYEGACGRIPIQGLLKVAKEKQMEITRLDYRNSGDTAGTKDRVVGYGAWILKN